MIEGRKDMNIYWANLCILNRRESEMMEAAAEAWKADGDLDPRMIYLGNTEEVKMYEQMDRDMASGSLGFDLLVTTRFDLFCSHRYLQGRTENILPMGDVLPLRDEVKRAGVPDPDGLFFPLALLPHYIVCNADMMPGGDCPTSLEELLDPVWAGKIFVGATDLPSARAVLFTVWYNFGKEGLEACVRNWRQKSAPSAARHGLVKGECPIALLPGIFAGPGPGDTLVAVWPEEGAPVLPSFAAVRKSEYADQVVDFFLRSAGSREFSVFYRDQGFAYPVDPGVDPPDIGRNRGQMIFPDWEWILGQDMDYFLDACERVPKE